LLILALEGERPGFAAAVELTSPAITCPSAGELRESLDRHVPADAPPLRLRLDEGDRSVRIQLETAGGEVALARTLERPATDPPSCRALASTAALIVERYLREIAYRAAAPSAPDLAETAPAEPPAVVARAAEAPASPLPTQVLLGVGGGARSGFGTGGGRTRGEVHVSVGVERWRLALWAEAGLATTEDVTAVGGARDVNLRLRAFPLRLLLGMRLPAGPTQIVPLVGVGADLLQGLARAGVDTAHSWRLEPAAEAGLALRASPTPSLWLRATLLGGVTLAARDYLVDAAANAPAFRTPAAFARLSVEAGVILGKK
jgi:hypothetical protein